VHVEKMPLEIVTTPVKTTGPLRLYDAPYALVYQWGYGRMDATTPQSGLATFHLASCSAVVLHCATTGRTTLSHSPNFLYMNTFAPMFDWVTGGDGTVSFNSLASWYVGRDAGGPPTPRQVEAVVLRGFCYADPTQAANFGHAGWMADFRSLCDKLERGRSIQVSVTDAAEYVMSGALLVDKVGARITYLRRRGVPATQAASATGGDAIVRLEGPGAQPPYSRPAQMRDLFMGNLLGQRFRSECVDLHLQYDVNHYRSAIPLTPEGRELLRSKMSQELASAQAAIIRAHGNSRDWTQDAASPLRGVFISYPGVGMPCEVCPLPGPKTCAACRGAWYCSAEHQRSDWTAHKAWCKAHAKTN
jgi:hypothetical protein